MKFLVSLTPLIVVVGYVSGFKNFTMLFVAWMIPEQHLHIFVVVFDRDLAPNNSYWGYWANELLPLLPKKFQSNAILVRSDFFKDDCLGTPYEMLCSYFHRWWSSVLSRICFIYISRFLLIVRYSPWLHCWCFNYCIYNGRQLLSPKLVAVIASESFKEVFQPWGGNRRVPSWRNLWPRIDCRPVPLLQRLLQGGSAERTTNTGLLFQIESADSSSVFDVTVFRRKTSL